jgi:hypothetical protein
MKLAIALVALALSHFPQDTGRVPIAPETKPASNADRVVAGIGEAREGLKAWIASAEAGAEIDAAELARIREAAQLLVTDLQTLHGRARAQSAGKPKAEKAAARKDEAPSSGSRDIAKAWTDDARALGEGGAERREKALLAVRNALTGGDPTATLAALQTLAAIGDVEYDRASFRPLVLPFARDAQKDLVSPAFYALWNTAHEPSDLDLLHAAWLREPDALRESMLHLMSLFGGGTLEGRSEEIALELLADRDRNLNVQFSGLWGARVGPRLEARVLELSSSADHEMRHAAIYFGLSTFADKSKAVVDALIAALTDPDSNNSDRALWGLGQGVPEALQRDVAAALVDLHNGRSDPRTRERCIRLVKQYGGPELEAKLKK